MHTVQYLLKLVDLILTARYGIIRTLVSVFAYTIR